MAPHGTSRSLLIFFLGVVVLAQVVQAERAGLLNKQKQLEHFIVDDGRIVGGVSTTAENFPWQLFVKIEENGGTYVCGGSIISETWSMSAAHCFASADPNADEGHIITAEKIYLYAGVTDKYNLSDSAVQSNIFNEDDFEEHLFVHPEYMIGARFNNDITIFKNKEPWTLNEYASPIALANDDDFIVGKELTASGWGKTCPSCSTSSILLYVDGLNLISREDCTSYWGASRITDNMICHATKNANTCGGDSGGPVITGSGESNGPPYVQIGIVSWGSSICDAFVPKVFADVAKYRNWIDETMSEPRVDVRIRQIIDSSGEPYGPPDRVVDGDDRSHWNPFGLPRYHNDWYIIFELAKMYTLDSLKLINYGDTTHDVTSFKIEVSDDKVNWYNGGIVNNVKSGTHEWQSFDNVIATGKYVKFTVTQTYEGWQPWLCEIGFTGYSGSTSNTCEEDSSSKCGKLASKGKCSKGKVFFKCKSSCACGVGSNPPCTDTRSKCSKWAAKGKCSEKKVYTKCKSSCACAVEDGSKVHL